MSSKSKQGVSQLARVSQYGRVTRGLRKKLKAAISRPETCNICDLFLQSQEPETELTRIVQEFETFILMKLEHYYGEEDLFKFDKKTVETIQSNIKMIQKQVAEKFTEATSDGFGRYDLAGKYLLVKSILKAVENTRSSGTEMLKDVRWHFVLGDPLFTALVTHLFDESEDQTLTASNKTSAEFVFKFVFKNIRFFQMPNGLLEKMVNFHFELELPKRDQFKRTHKTGIYEGNEPLHPDELVQATFKSYKGDRYFGTWHDKKIRDGVVFSKEGDMYTGTFYNKKPHGKGYLRKSNGTSFFGVWKNGDFQHGYQILQYERGVFGELIDSGNQRTGVTVYHKVDLDQTKAQRNKSDLVDCLRGTGASGIYTGEYNGEIRSGNGTMYFADRSVYFGGWKKDKRHGKGTYYGVNREKYEGDWVFDKREGTGEMIFENGDHYEGEWYADRMEGRGTYISSEGEVRSGTWRDNFFVSKLRDNKKIHDGIHQNMRRKSSVKQKKKMVKKTGKKIAEYLDTVRMDRFGNELLKQTKKFGL